MAAYVWPTDLPPMPITDYAETDGVLVLRSPMDAGPAKLRRRGARPATMTVSYEMTSAQVSSLRTFVLTTLKGTARFDYVHPRTGSTVEVRIVPGQDGELYSVAYHAHGHWIIGMSLEVMP